MDSALTMVLWGQFPVDAEPSHTKYFKNVGGPCLHGTQDEVGSTSITGQPGVSIM